MNCANHGNVAAVAYCRTCGKPLCNACARNVGGAIYCEQCAATQAPGAPVGVGIPAYPMHANPSVAGLLGLIPGVGAMYNGQFMKGLFNVGIFVALVALADRVGPVMVPVFFAYFFYSVFDAYKTSFAIQNGLPLPDPFGLEAMFGQGVNHTTWQRPAPPPTGAPMPGTPGWDPAQQQAYQAQQQAYAAQQEGSAAQQAGCERSGIPVGAVILIGLGCLFLLDNMGWFSFSVDRFWPLILIVIGGWLFYKRWNRRVS